MRHKNAVHSARCLPVVRSGARPQPLPPAPGPGPGAEGNMESVCCALSSSDMTLSTLCGASAGESGIGGCCASRATTLKPNLGRVSRSTWADRIAGVSTGSPSWRPHAVWTPSNGIRGPLLGSPTPSRVSPQGPKSWTILGMMLAMSISIRMAPASVRQRRREQPGYELVSRVGHPNTSQQGRGATTHERRSHGALELPGTSGSTMAFYSNVLPGNSSDPPDSRAESIMTLTSTTSAILWMPQDRLHNWPYRWRRDCNKRFKIPKEPRAARGVEERARECGVGSSHLSF